MISRYRLVRQSPRDCLPVTSLRSAKRDPAFQITDRASGSQLALLAPSFVPPPVPPFPDNPKAASAGAFALLLFSPPQTFPCSIERNHSLALVALTSVLLPTLQIRGPVPAFCIL